MFKRGERLIYEAPHAKRGIKQAPEECAFYCTDGETHAICLFKKGTSEFNKRRTVRLKYLKKDLSNEQMPSL